MKRHFIVLIALMLISQTAYADLVGRVNDCYQRFSDVKEASRCADLKLALALQNLQAGGGNGPGPGPDPRPRVAELYSCSNHGDPQFKKSIIDHTGETLREDVLQVITQGGDEDEKIACLAKLQNAPHKLPRSIKAQCSCSSHGDPKLLVELIDRNYQTIKSIELFTFTVGGDLDEQRDCQQTLQALQFCQAF